jgi:hypothetical protein
VPHGFAGVETGSIPGLDDFSPEAFLTGFDGVQPYHLAIIGEKSSLDPVLGPLAEEYRADLYLPTGHISDSYLYDLARISAVDGRPLRIFYVHDCDPYGFDMARTVAYKVGLLVMFGFPGLDAQLYRVALTPDQVKDLGLPSAPFGDEGTTRRDKWRAAWGIDQTEVDALATLQPRVLEQIVRDALDEFYDHSLSRRVREARSRWQVEADRALAAHLAETDAAEILAEIQQTCDHLAKLNDRLRRSAGRVALPAVPGLPIGDPAADYGCRCWPRPATWSRRSSSTRRTSVMSDPKRSHRGLSQACLSAEDDHRAMEEGNGLGPPVVVVGTPGRAANSHQCDQRGTP